MTLTIKYKDIDLRRVTQWGLGFLLECLEAQECYEWCAEVRNELNFRKIMGVDCCIIAKRKDGDYYVRHLDRLYVFTYDLEGYHDSLSHCYGVCYYKEGAGVDFPMPDKIERFYISRAMRWCEDRLYVLRHDKNAQKYLNENCHGDIEYHEEYVTKMLEFLEFLRPEDIEWVGLFSDSGVLGGERDQILYEQTDKIIEL